MATNFGRTRCWSREKERCACVAKSSANIFFNRSAKNDYLICADEKTSINDKHLTVKRQVGLDNHGSPPMTPTYVQRSTFRGRQDSTITGIR
jgi:hypothetical protein